jgi:hypothetical protein
LEEMDVLSGGQEASSQDCQSFMALIPSRHGYFWPNAENQFNFVPV